MSIKDNDAEIKKLTHDLSMTIYNITKSKPIKIKNDIIDMFLKLFVDVNDFENLKQSLIDEINNHDKGISTTFQDYRTKRNRLFQRAQSNIYQNVKKSVSYNNLTKFITIPIKTNNNNYIIISIIFDQYLTKRANQSIGSQSGAHNVNPTLEGSLVTGRRLSVTDVR